MAWRLALSLEQLRNELNFWWPNRDHSSDGAIGDTAHAATWSDHNPNAQGVVCAYDLDTDLDGTDDSNDPVTDALVEFIRTHPHPDLKYVIYRGRMFSSYPVTGFAAFEWRSYTKDPHISHPHISVGTGPDGRSAPGTYDDMTPWLTGFQGDDMPSAEEVADAVLAKLQAPSDTFPPGTLSWAGVWHADLEATRGIVNTVNGIASLLAHQTGPAGPASLTDGDLEAIAKAVNDELARRQAS